MAAIAMDPALIPWTADGPTRTLPIPDYIQDGEYEDRTKQFAIQYADTKQFMTDLLSRKRQKKKTTTAEE